MLTMCRQKYIPAILPISLLVLLALLPASSASAYGTANWQTAFAGTFVTPGTVSTGFWGWCAFFGVTSGTDADCQVSQYIHVTHSVSITCEVSADVTGWDIEPSPQLHGMPGSFITSGQFTVNPSSATEAC